MKLIVNPHTVEIQKDLVNEKEINITRCEFEFSEEITDDFVKEAYFTINGKTYKEIIIADECAIPYEVIEEKGQVEVGVVAYVIDNEEILQRYNPSPAYFNTMYGSLKDNAENSEPITPSEMEQFEQALQDGINQIANIDINAEETETGGIVEVTNKDGETTTITLTNGVDGEPGPQGIPGPRGETGSTGPAGQDGFSPIANVSKSGKIATITITDKNGTTTETISDGQNGQNGSDGADGKDAKINGVNTLTIEAGSNINIEQEGSTMTISSTGGSGGTSDYSDLTNKPSINNVELSGNKTTSDLGINIPDVSNFITKDVDDLTYYTKSSNLSSVATSGSYEDLTNKPTIPIVPTNVSAFTNDSGYTTTSYVDNKEVIKYSYYINLPITTSQATNYPLTTEDKLKIEEICTLYNADSSVLKSIIIYSTLNKGGSTASTYNPKEFFVNSIDQYEVVFTTLPFLEEKDYANSYSRLHIKQIRLTYNRSAETISVGSSESTSPIASYIGIKNYSSPFVPTIDGHPTNKKYVDDNLANKVIYLGKINNYDTSAKALDITNYKANTRILLKNNDSTRSFYIKVGSNVAEVPATGANDVSVINNIFYLDINSISGSTASIAVIWASTYQWGPIVTNTIMVSFTSSGATVGSVTRNIQAYTLFQLEEDSNGDLDTTTLQEFVSIRSASFSKQRAPQRPAIHYFDKDKNSCVLSFTSMVSGSQQVYEGIMTTKQPNTNGYYETYKVRLELNYSGTTYSNHVLTKTKIGVVLDDEVEEKDMVVTYTDNTTETIKLVVYR